MVFVMLSLSFPDSKRCYNICKFQTFSFRLSVEVFCFLFSFLFFVPCFFWRIFIRFNKDQWFILIGLLHKSL